MKNSAFYNYTKAIAGVIFQFDRWKMNAYKVDCRDGNRVIAAIHNSVIRLVAKSRSVTSSDLTTDSVKRKDELTIAKLGFSIVTACMNRNENLLEAVQSWTLLPVNEIIVVDWNSVMKVTETLSRINDPRIIVVRVDNEEQWCLTRAFNLGLMIASYQKIFKFDADITTNEYFLTQNSFAKKQYVRGHYRDALDRGDKSQIFINGSFGAFKSDLRRIGYYNESIQTYGWDDSNLYQRLNESNMTQLFLKNESLHHLHQEADSRTRHQKLNKKKFLSVVEPHVYHNIRNKYLSNIWDHWNFGLLCDYALTGEGRATFATKISEEVTLPVFVHDDASIYAAIYFLKRYKYKFFRKFEDMPRLAKVLTSEFEAGIPFGLSEKLLTDDETTQVVKTGDCRKTDICIFNNTVSTVSIFTAEQLCDLNLLRTNAGFSALTEDGAKTVEHDTGLKVIIDVQHGLGNRLRALSSAAVLAEQLGRRLIVIWHPDEHCRCEFMDLFSDQRFPVISQLPKAEVLACFDEYNYMELGDDSCKGALINIDTDKDIYVRSAYVLNYASADWATENKFLKSLKPSKDVENLLAPFVNIDFDLSIHIRMQGAKEEEQSDHDGEHNWLQDSHEEIVKWRQASHFRKFIDKTREIADSHLKQGTRLNVFVAADNPEAYQAFSMEEKYNVFYIDRAVFDRSKDQLLYALADAILLSKGSSFLGSQWSSFSELANRYSEGFVIRELCGVDF